MINQVDNPIIEKLTWNNTLSHGYYRLELNIFLIILISAIVFIVLLVYYNLRHRELSERYLLIKFIVYALIIIAVDLLFLYEVIRIWISVDSVNSNIVWTILLTILNGIFLVIIGVGNSMRQLYKTLLVVMIAYLFFVGFGFFGFLFHFDLPFLLYKWYETNTIRGIYFFVSNLYVFMIIYIVSFISESEVRD